MCVRGSEAALQLLRRLLAQHGRTVSRRSRHLLFAPILQGAAKRIPIIVASTMRCEEVAFAFMSVARGDAGVALDHSTAGPVAWSQPCVGIGDGAA